MRILKIATACILIQAIAVFGCGREKKGGESHTQASLVVKKLKNPATTLANKPGKKPSDTQKPSSGSRTMGSAKASGKTSQTVIKTVSHQGKAKYVYRRMGRPDPFRPFFIEAPSTEINRKCEGIPPGPLTEKEVGQFTLVGIISRAGHYVAMVQDTEGKGYFLTVNSYIGKKCGKVTHIGPDKVIVEEPYRDLLGNERTRKVALELKRPKGGK